MLGTRGRVLTFQLHICQLVGRAETMSVETDPDGLPGQLPQGSALTA